MSSKEDLLNESDNLSTIPNNPSTTDSMYSASSLTSLNVTGITNFQSNTALYGTNYSASSRATRSNNGNVWSSLDAVMGKASATEIGLGQTMGNGTLGSSTLHYSAPSNDFGNQKQDIGKGKSSSLVASTYGPGPNSPTFDAFANRGKDGRLRSIIRPFFKIFSLIWVVITFLSRPFWAYLIYPAICAILKLFNVRSVWLWTLIFVGALEAGNIFLSHQHPHGNDLAHFSIDIESQEMVINANSTIDELNNAVGQISRGDPENNDPIFGSVFKNLFSESQSREGGVGMAAGRKENESIMPEKSVTVAATSRSTISPVKIPLERDEVSCEEIVVGNTLKYEEHMTAQAALFKLCGINYLIGCATPPCLDETEEGVHRSSWPYPVLRSAHYNDIFIEKQKSDIFLYELNANNRHSPVVDIGSNIGYFSQIAAVLGYKIYSLDAQPLCSQHSLTSAVANGRENYIRSYSVGISTLHGEVLVRSSVCKQHFDVNDVKTAAEEVEGTDDKSNDTGYHRDQEYKATEFRLIPLMRLSKFLEENIANDTGIRLMNIDTDGAEIDILRSGLDLFQSGRVFSLIVQVRVTAWESGGGELNKGSTLTEGVDLLGELAKIYSETYVLGDSGYSYSIEKLEMDDNSSGYPKGVRGPLYPVDKEGFPKYIDDRLEKDETLHIWYRAPKLPKTNIASRKAKNEESTG